MTTAPAYVGAGTIDAGTFGRTTINLAVPATSVLTGLLDIAAIYIEHTTAPTPPDGTWTEAPDSPQGGVSHFCRVFWRRPTGSETGTYNFTHPTAWSSGFAFRISGVITTGDPFDVTNGAIKNTSADGSTPAVSDTTTVANTLLLWIGQSFSGGECSTVSGFTERVDSPPGDSAATTLDTKAQAVAGATGSLTAAFTIAAPTTAWLGALLPIPDATTDTHGMLGLF
jgi:hypothetical protein